MESLSYLYASLACAEMRSADGQSASPIESPHWRRAGWLATSLVAGWLALGLSARSQAGLPVASGSLLTQQRGDLSQAADGDSTLLQLGDRGARVQQLQRRLQALGTYDGPLSGIFGEQTAAAVRRFQAARGLTVDGIAGPDTWAALNPSSTPQTASVTRWQQKLQVLGYYDRAPSGTYDEVTQSAVRRFQAARGLAVDGIVGPATRQALAAALDPATIRDLQSRLQQGGFYTGAVDGIWGPLTQAAVEAARTVYGVNTADLVGNDY